MKIYIATAMANRAAAVECARLLTDRGHMVTSAWHDQEELTAEDAMTDEDRARHAAENFAAVEFANVLIFLDHRWARGALVEVGFAWGRGRVVIGIGPREGRSLMAEYCGAWFSSINDAMGLLG